MNSAAQAGPATEAGAMARGVLEQVVAATATKPAYLVLAVPGTQYRVHLRFENPVRAAEGKRIAGIITLHARRVDTVRTGGRFIEPVFGRPRRVQGTVVAIDEQSGTLTINSAVPVVAKLLDPRQKASQFSLGDLVSFDAMDGARFQEA